jgi:hypothetical protein
MLMSVLLPCHAEWSACFRISILGFVLGNRWAGVDVVVVRGLLQGALLGCQLAQ